MDRSIPLEILVCRMLRILITCFNARAYLPRCIASIRGQRFRDWRAYLTDDLSTDGSPELIQSLIDDDPRLELIRNHEKRYQVGNYLQILRRPGIDDDDVAVMVDGDDWLPDARVFCRVVDAYRDGKTWLTWGSHRRCRQDGRLLPGCCGPLPDAAAIRSHPWVTSALRTCKAFLFRAIHESDLRSPAGHYWEAAGDLACMMPMVEMAGNLRIKFLTDFNYVYNVANPLRDARLHAALQRHNATCIRGMPAYSLLER